MSSESTQQPIVVAIDAGTTGVRAFAIDLDGVPVGRAYEEFTQHFPQPGWVEHDAAEIWQTTCRVLAQLDRELGRPIVALGITDQRETVVAWDRRTGTPRHRAIVWQDRRTAARCDELAAAGELDRVRRATGLVLDPYFSATKFEWLLGPGGVAADDDLVLGTIDSWLIWNLTGGAEHVTDTSNASRTMLYDICAHRWSEELCDLFGVPMASLPRVVPSAGPIGVTVDGCGLAAGVPVTGIAGDQQASLFGQACVHPGMAKNTYGTGSFVLMNIGERCPDPSEGLLTTVGWTVPARMLGAEGDELVTHYALEGSIFVTGAAVQWLRDGLGIIDEASEVGALAASIEDSAGVVLVPAFTGLGSPYWDPYARGTVVGITRGAGRAHLARAVVESMAFQTRDVVEAMTAVSGEPLAELRVDGGAAAMALLLQLQADQLGVPVARSAVQETTALGAAYLAGLGAGIWSTVDEVNQRWAADARVEPAADGEAVDAAYAQWSRAVERSRGWAQP
jgi:glycerol kinase